jgi:hypothetical protein
MGLVFKNIVFNTVQQFFKVFPPLADSRNGFPLPLLFSIEYCKNFLENDQLFDIRRKTVGFESLLGNQTKYLHGFTCFNETLIKQDIFGPYKIYNELLSIL